MLGVFWASSLRTGKRSMGPFYWGKMGGYGEGEGPNPPEPGLQRVVPRGHPKGRARRLRARAGHHRGPPLRVRHLGEHPAGSGPHVQGDRPPERLLPPLHPHELSQEGGGARGGVLPRARRGHPRGGRGAGGAPGGPPHLGDGHRLHVVQVDQELARPAPALEPVGQRGALGDAHAAFPSHERVSVAGGAHRPRHPGGGGGGGAEDALHLRPPRPGVRRHPRD